MNRVSLESPLFESLHNFEAIPPVAADRKTAAVSVDRCQAFFDQLFVDKNVFNLHKRHRPGVAVSHYESTWPVLVLLYIVLGLSGRPLTISAIDVKSVTPPECFDLLFIS